MMMVRTWKRLPKWETFITFFQRASSLLPLNKDLVTNNIISESLDESNSKVFFFVLFSFPSGKICQIFLENPIGGLRLTSLFWFGVLMFCRCVSIWSWGSLPLVNRRTMKPMETVFDLIEEAKIRTVWWALCIFAMTYFLTRKWFLGLRSFLLISAKSDVFRMNFG